MHGDQPIMGGQRGKLVVGAGKGQAAMRRQFGGNPAAEIRMGVEAGADGGAADRERIERSQASADTTFGLAQLRHIAGKFLTERERGGILQMGTADLDDVGKGGGLALETGDQLA